MWQAFPVSSHHRSHGLLVPVLRPPRVPDGGHDLPQVENELAALVLRDPAGADAWAGAVRTPARTGDPRQPEDGSADASADPPAAVPGSRSARGSPTNEPFLEGQAERPRGRPQN